MPDPACLVVAGLLRDRPARLGAVRLVTVDGPSGSGKSTFAAELAAWLGRDGVDVALVSTDLLATWDDPFDWWPHLESGLLGPLAAGQDGVLARVTWVAGEPVPAPPLAVPVPQVLVLEGVSAGRRLIAARTSVAVWVEVPDAARRLERAVTRDGESSRTFLQQWQVAEQAHFARESTRSRAEVVVDPDRGPSHGSRRNSATPSS